MHLALRASILAAAAALALAEAGTDSDVLSLTAASFDSVVPTEPLALIEFFAPWCGHCKALAPHYEEAATALKDKNIKLMKVDCVEESELCQKHEVQGYPTLKVFRNGEPSEYTGPRKADGIISYMVKQSLPAVSEVNSENHEEFSKADKIVAIAYLPSSSAAPAAEFSAVANAHRDDYLFGVVTDTDVAAAAGVVPPAVVVYRSFDEPRTEFPLPPSAATRKELEDWLAELAIPTVGEVNGETYGLYASSPKPLAYLFIDPTREDKDTHIATLEPVAKKFKNQVNFVWIDAVKFGDHAKALNVVEPKWPAFVIQDIGKQLKYPFDQSKEITTEALEAYLQDFTAGNVQPQLKSEPIPEAQDGAVHVLVGKNFEEVVFDDSKDVLVEFYATWCGHCKRLAPIYEDLGQKYADIKDKVVIAKFEATENDVPPSLPFKISGFPTLKFKPAGSKEWVDYEGDRTFDSLVAFVEKNAKNSLEIPAPAPVPVPEPTEEAQAPAQSEGVVHEEL